MDMTKNDSYWKNRELDWEDAYWNPEHPHRKMLVEVLKDYPFQSVLEIGCGAGVNLWNIKEAFPDVSLAGCDINSDAIEFAKTKLPDADLKVGNAEALPFHGGKYDLILTDAMLIYIHPNRIRRVLREIRRVGSRGGIVCFIEFHSKSLAKRLGLRLTSRYFAYDYQKILKAQYFKGIRIFKLGKDKWPGQPWESFGSLILAVI